MFLMPLPFSQSGPPSAQRHKRLDLDRNLTGSRKRRALLEAQKARLAAGSLRKSAAIHLLRLLHSTLKLKTPSPESQSTVGVKLRALWYPYESYVEVPSGESRHIMSLSLVLRLDSPRPHRHCFEEQSTRLQAAAAVAKAQILAYEWFASSLRIWLGR